MSLRFVEMVFISQIECGLGWYVLLYETVRGITVIKMLRIRTHEADHCDDAYCLI